MYMQRVHEACVNFMVRLKPTPKIDYYIHANILKSRETSLALGIWGMDPLPDNLGGSPR